MIKQYGNQNITKLKFKKMTICNNPKIDDLYDVFKNTEVYNEISRIPGFDDAGFQNMLSDDMLAEHIIYELLKEYRTNKYINFEDCIKQNCSKENIKSVLNIFN